MGKDSKVIDLVFTLSIFFEIFLTSSWQILHPGLIWKSIGYSLYIFILFLLIMDFFFRKGTLSQILFLAISIILIFFFIVKINIQFAILVLFCGCAAFMDEKKLLKIYFIGMGTAVIIIVFLSCLNVLPLYSQQGLLSFGFRNPNTLGFYLLVLFLIYLCLRENNNNFLPTIIFFVFSVICVYLLDDYTAFAAMFFSFFLYSFKKFGKKLSQYGLFKIIFPFLPWVLLTLSVWIGVNYYNYSWMERLNGIFTNRPILWNYYLTRFPPNLFGNDIPDNISFIGGAFDGSYVYYLIVYGFFFFALMLILVSLGIYKANKKGDYTLQILITVLIITAFSENSPFVAIQSPLMPLCVLLIFSKVQTNKQARRCEEK